MVFLLTTTGEASRSCLVWAFCPVGICSNRYQIPFKSLSDDSWQHRDSPAPSARWSLLCPQANSGLDSWTNYQTNVTVTDHIAVACYRAICTTVRLESMRFTYCLMVASASSDSLFEEEPSMRLRFNNWTAKKYQERTRAADSLGRRPFEWGWRSTARRKR